MHSSASILRLVLAVSLLFAQITGGFARLVHCYDSKCTTSGVRWECHVNCDGNHASECESTCEHERCEPSASTKNAVRSDEVLGMAIIQSPPCGSDHHHHYIASIDLVLAALQSSESTDFLTSVVFFDWPLQVLGVRSLRLSSRGQDAGGHPTIPLVTRLRI